jgi:signal transduction histidine kinase
MTQVAVNLVDNAVKFSPADSTVRVSVSADDSTATLCVTDTGPGMTAEQGARVFDRFVQLSDGDTRAAGGSGLGLAIVRGIVEQHGGSVYVDSTPGVGSTFTVRLPLRAAR